MACVVVDSLSVVWVDVAGETPALPVMVLSVCAIILLPDYGQVRKPALPFVLTKMVVLWWWLDFAICML